MLICMWPRACRHCLQALESIGDIVSELKERSGASSTPASAPAAHDAAEETQGEAPAAAADSNAADAAEAASGEQTESAMAKWQILEDAVRELGLPAQTAAALGVEGIDDAETLLLYSADELAAAAKLRGGHARKLLAHFNTL